VFQEIQQGEQLAEEAKRKIVDIRANLVSLEQMCVQTNNRMSSYVTHFEQSEKADKKDPAERREKLDQIKSEYYNIRSKYSLTKAMLTGLKNRVDEQIIKLKSYKETLFGCMMDNASKSLALGYQTMKLSKHASRDKLGQMFAVTGGYTTLVALDYYTMRRVGEFIEEQRKKF